MTLNRSDSDAAQVDAGVVARLVASQFPEWAGLPVTPVDKSGVDNATFRLGDALSVRLPRYRRWVGQVEREQRWLPHLAPHLPLPVPTPVARGEAGCGYPYPWSVYRWIDGENASIERVDDPRGAAKDLAAFFAALQGLDADGGPPPEWSNGFRGVPIADTRDSAVVESRIRARIAALHGLTDTDALTAIYEAALAAPAWSGAPVWIHGDPAPGNLLARDGRVSAVIDFGTLAVGDPACDLIVAWTFLDAAGREVFRNALAVDRATWARGRAWGLTGILPSRADLTDPARSHDGLRRIGVIVRDLEAGG